jgi:hypothetical protein
MADRRDFLGSLLAAGAVTSTGPGAFSGRLPASAKASLPWLKRIRGDHRAVFDNPRDDGTGVIRAWIWLNQCRSLLAAKDDDCTAVVIMRHGGVTLAMDDGFWDKYELAKSGGTPEKPNIPKRNPVMAAVMKEDMSGYPPPARPWAEGVGLDPLLARGAVVLACEFAFWGLISRVMNRDKIEESAARQIAMAHLLPGVSLVPSGFFALAVCQRQGCSFVTNA